MTPWRKDTVFRIATTSSVKIPDGYCGILSLCNLVRFHIDDTDDFEEEQADENGLSPLAWSGELRPLQIMYGSGTHENLSILVQTTTERCLYFYPSDLVARLAIVKLYEEEKKN